MRAIAKAKTKRKMRRHNNLGVGPGVHWASRGRWFESSLPAVARSAKAGHPDHKVNDLDRRTWGDEGLDGTPSKARRFFRMFQETVGTGDASCRSSRERFLVGVLGGSVSNPWRVLWLGTEQDTEVPGYLDEQESR